MCLSKDVVYVNCQHSQLVIDNDQNASHDQGDLSSPGPNKQIVHVFQDRDLPKVHDI